MQLDIGKTLRVLCSFVAAAAVASFSDSALRSNQAYADLIVPKVRVITPRQVPEIPNEDQRQVKKIDPKTAELPFSGAAAKSSEELNEAIAGKSFAELYDAVRILVKEKMYLDAYALNKKLLTPETSEEDYRTALASAAQIVQSLGVRRADYSDYESLLQKALETYPQSWRMKTSVAQAFHTLPVYGVMSDGQFVPQGRGGYESVSREKNLRVRRLQLYAEALPLVREEGKKLVEFYEANPDNDANLEPELDALRIEIGVFFANFYDEFSNSANSEWQKQTLTDLTQAPEFESMNVAHGRNRNQGAPVDEAGNPIFYLAPKSFEEAKNDGERLLALEEERLVYDRTKQTRAAILKNRANRSHEVYGVHTLQSYRFFFNDDAATAESEANAGIWSLSSLKDGETIARLANGVKRFELPEGYDYIELWREAYELNPSDYYVLRNIAREYENRRQFSKAAEVWEQLLEVQSDDRNARESLSQILDPRVRIETSSPIDGLNAKLNLRFRNATGATVTAKRLDIDSAVDFIRKSNLWKNEVRLNVVNLVTEALRREYLPREAQRNADEDKLFNGLGSLVKEEVANFKLTLKPNPDHYDSVQTIDFPIHEPGAYLVDVAANAGNHDVAIVWLRDVAIVHKPYDDGHRLFVLDAATGQPLADRAVEFFIVEESWAGNKRVYKTQESKSRTDAAGSVLYPNDSLDPNFPNRILTVVPSTDKKKKNYALMDLTPIWRLFADREARFYQQRAFFVSDRPIYRPKQKAEFKFIVGNAQYDAPEKSAWANQEVAYCIMSPTGDRVVKKTVKLDEYGAFSDTFEIPEDARLGVYSVEIARRIDENGSIFDYLGDGYFRLEEYRKPEFEVKVDAPKDPVALGDSFKAKVNAKYYFGAPVTKGTVSYKVTRTSYRSNYYPSRYWDWFYGCGYWQFEYEAEWYPGWLRWGCPRLPSFHLYHNPGVPEIVAEGEAELDSEGNFEISVDTELAKTIYPNDDQQYAIDVEVTDDSRRTIVGSGKVFAARKPFQTYVWLDRGYYRVGDKMSASFQARRLDGKPVEGSAVVKLYKIAYEKTNDDSVKPIETEVFTQDVKANEEGKGEVEIVAAEPGQYRVSCVVSTESGLSEEGGRLVVVRGAKKTSQVRGDFRFNALEIVPDKPEYSVGDVARIQIASNNPNAYVLFAARPKGDSAVGKPQFVKLENGTAYVDVQIEAADQPNIFVQATTVFDGKLYSEQRELAVPPEKRVLDVAVEPCADRVKPGSKATVKLRLTDVDGKPVVGQTVVTVYDKSLEYVSGGSNVGDIREFFWKWRRYANLSSHDNLAPRILDAFGLVYQRDAQTRLRQIGAFGSDLMEFNDASMGMGMGMPMGGGLSRMSKARSGMRMEADEALVDDAVEMEESAEAPMMARDFAAPMMAMAAAPAPMAANGALMKTEATAVDSVETADVAAAEKPLVEAVVRTNLADLAYWAADLKSEDDGELEIEIDMPDNLTTWKICAWAVGDGLRVGSGESEIVTSKDFIIRMQKPRFLTQKDEVVLSANVHNYLSEEKNVQVSLEFPTDDAENSTARLSFLEGVDAAQKVVVPANGETRIDWTVRADVPGVATLLMKALTDEESDAIQETIVVKEHGMSKQIAVSGVVPPADKDAQDQASQAVRESTFTLTIPEERRKETTKLTVRYSPTLAGAIFDALPYLMEYPYGCTEQTLNRFLPLVVAQKSLLDSGVDLAQLKSKRVNLNAQELGDAQERAKQWKRRRAIDEPVFDIELVRKITAYGVAKLTSTQNPDGGWGWFGGVGSVSSARITALVAIGLKRAQECDQAIEDQVLARAQNWLVNYEREQALKIVRGKVWTDEQKRETDAWNRWKLSADAMDAAVYYALSELGVQPTGFSDEFVDYENAKLNADNPMSVHAVMKELVWEARDGLELYPLSTYAIALANEPNATDDTKLRVETILRLLSQYREVDEENQTVWLELSRFNGWLFWNWYGGNYETQAYYLRLLQRVDRATLDKLGLADDASRLVKYLLTNRKNATYWNSTRDTALCVEAFTEYLQKTNELAPNQTVEILVDGELRQTTEYTPDGLFETDGTLVLDANDLESGDHTVTMRVKGDGPLYYNAYLEFYTLEDPIEKAGLEVKAERRYYKLVERKDATAVVEGGHGQAVTQRVEKFDRVPLKSGDEIVSGDKIEIELIVESKNEYESILLEDAKPAGFEPLEQRSGYNGNALGAYVEFRDDRVCFFASSIPQGKTSVTYTLRAETPGKFSALPAKIWAMYAPELKGNSDEFKTQVNDK